MPKRKRGGPYDDFLQIAQLVDAQFALIDLESGQLRDPMLALRVCATWASNCKNGPVASTKS